MPVPTLPPSPASSATPPPRDACLGRNLKVDNHTQPPVTYSHDPSPNHRERLGDMYNRRTIPLMTEDDFSDICDATACEFGSTTSPAFHAALAERVKQRTKDVEEQLMESKMACMLDSNLSEEDDRHLMNVQQETSLGRSLFIIEALRARPTAFAINTKRRSNNGIAKNRRGRRTQPSASSTTNAPRRSGRIRDLKRVGT